MGCTVLELIEDIRHALNECEEVTGCECGSRYTNLEILRAINDAIGHIASLRKDEFTSISEHEFGAGCHHNVCNIEGCDEFLKVNYSINDPCYIPIIGCESDKNILNNNKCLEFKTDAVDDSTILEWKGVDPKNPCLIFIKREDDSSTTIASITCFSYPDELGIDDSLSEKLCRKYRMIIFNQAMYLLIQRDHVDTQAYIVLLEMYRDTANSMMRDLMSADGMYWETGKFLGRTYGKDCEEK